MRQVRSPASYKEAHPSTCMVVGNPENTSFACKEWCERGSFPSPGYCGPGLQCCITISRSG